MPDAAGIELEDNGKGSDDEVDDEDDDDPFLKA